MSRNAGTIASAGAVLVGASAEAVLIWLVGQLPIWAQILVYGVPVALMLVGAVILVQEARAKRRRRLRQAEAKITRARITPDRPGGPGTG